MNWRALLQDQWFQLCLLVALLSAGTIVYNATNKTGPPSGTGTNKVESPARTAQPAPRRITPKMRGEWILDASGARDADGADLAAVVASLTDGDVVTLRPGDYTGNCEINVSARFIGPPADKGVATMRFNDPKRVGLSISGKKVSLENLTINFDVAGEGPAIRIAGDSSVEMTNCSTATKSKFDVYLTEKASLRAQGSSFQTSGTGCCLKCEGTAHVALSQCNLSDAHWGIEALGGVQLQADNCVFQKLGLPNGQGITVGVIGGPASASLKACQFHGNTAVIVAEEGATLNIIGSTFRENGVTGETSNTSSGMISVKSKAKAFLQDDKFYDNKQGLVACQEGQLTLEKVAMHRTGLITDNKKISGFSHAVIAYDKGTLTLTDCTIAESLQNGLFVGAGAHLKASKSTISDSGACGLILGFAKTPSARGELDKVKFLGAKQDGAAAAAGSQLTMNDCKISDMSRAGIQSRDASTNIDLTRTTIIGCSGNGLVALLGANISATGCTMKENARGAQAGVGTDPSSGGTITLNDCTVQQNTIFGIAAYPGGRLTMKGGSLGMNHADTVHGGGDVNVEP